jgi:hypothetical protein
VTPSAYLSAIPDSSLHYLLITFLSVHCLSWVQPGPALTVMFALFMHYISASAILVVIHTGMVLGDSKFSSSCTSLPESQYDALKDLYYSTNGLLWCLDSQQKWSFPPNQRTAAPCSEGWAGVSCGCELGTYHITGLAMSQFCMRGSIPASIGKKRSS